MTRNQLQAELVQADEKIRSANEALKTLRFLRSGLKTRLSEARLSEARLTLKAKGNPE